MPRQRRRGNRREARQKGKIDARVSLRNLPQIERRINPVSGRGTWVLTRSAGFCDMVYRLVYHLVIAFSEIRHISSFWRQTKKHSVRDK